MSSISVGVALRGGVNDVIYEWQKGFSLLILPAPHDTIDVFHEGLYVAAEGLLFEFVYQRTDAKYLSVVALA